MKLFNPYLHACMNTHLATEDDRRHNKDFWAFHDATPDPDSVWEENLAIYDNWLKTEAPQCVRDWYSGEPLHDEPMTHPNIYGVDPVSNLFTIKFTVGVREARIVCARYGCGTCVPRWMRSEHSEYLYDEFTLENGDLTFELYESSGHRHIFYGVNSIEIGPNF